MAAQDSGKGSRKKAAAPQQPKKPEPKYKRSPKGGVKGVGTKSNGMNKEWMHGMNAAAAETPRTLSDMMTRFVMSYIITWNATKAAIAAGYSEVSAKTRGPQLLKDVRVKALLDEYRAEIKSDFRTTHEALTQFYLRVLQADTPELLEQIEAYVQFGREMPEGTGMLIDSIKVKEVISGFEENPDKPGKMQPVMGKQIEFKLFSKQGAAEMLNRHVGYYEVDNKQKTPEGVAIYLPDNGRGDSTALPIAPEDGEGE